MRHLVYRLVIWWYRMYRLPFTVACDLHALWNPINREEVLFHVRGLARARWLGKRWVREHPHGQARILRRHRSFSRKEERDE